MDKREVSLTKANSGRRIPFHSIGACKMRARVVVILFATLLSAPRVALACVPHIEEHANSPSASFRPHTSASAGCEVSEHEYRRVVNHWLQNRAPGAAALSSLSLGRAEKFPWISQHLADAALHSEEWRTRAARGSAARQNSFVAATLSKPVFLRRLSLPFEGTSYSVLDVSVEKVLVGPASQYSSTNRTSNARVPFDAQVWLRLAPK